MNFSLLIGLVFGTGLIYQLIIGSVKNPLIFTNPHGILIVLGGTFAAALICFPFAHFLNIFKGIFRAILGQQNKEVINIINEIIDLAEVVNNNGELKSKIEKIKNPFLKECVQIVDEDIISHKEMEEIFVKRVDLQHERYRQENTTFKIIGKFPPAFGLIGATLGMIALLQNLGSPNGFKQLGPSMSIALTATFWGLVFANMILVPMGENLHLASQNDLVLRRVVAEGAKLLRDKKHPLVVEEYLKSYLAPKLRNKMKKIKL